jgi:hypothetical protein
MSLAHVACLYVQLLVKRPCKLCNGPRMRLRIIARVKLCDKL